MTLTTKSLRNQCFEKGRKRSRAKVKALIDELRERMHEPIREVGKWLTKVLVGHGVPGNYAALSLFRFRVYWTWRRALMGRSQKGYITWKKMNAIIDRWLPKPHICHPQPLERFGVRTQGRSLVR